MLEVTHPHYIFSRLAQKMASRWLISVLFWCLPLLNFAQEPELSVPPYAPGVFEHFQIADGLPTKCLNQGFIDDKGRIWLNPCSQPSKEFRLSFFQYDGGQSIFYDLRPEWLPEGSMAPTWYVIGITSDGFLYGANRKNDVLFYWHPDSRDQYFVKLSDGELLLNMDANEAGELYAWVLSVDSETYRVLRFGKGTISEIGSIRLDLEDDIVPHSPDISSFPFIMLQDQAWFLHQRKGLVKIDLNSKSMRFFDWSDLGVTDPIVKRDLDFLELNLEWKIVKLNEDEILLYLGGENGFFTLNVRTNEIDVNSRLNQISIRSDEENPLLRVYFGRDNADNLLITTGYFDPWRSYRGISNKQMLLIDSDGVLIDYNGFVPDMSEGPDDDFQYPGTFFGQDFEDFMVSSALEDGLIVLEMQPDREIDAFAAVPGYLFNTITVVDSLTLAVNSNLQVMRLDLRNGDIDRLLGKDGYHIELREYSPIIKKDDTLWMSAFFYREKRSGLQWYHPKTNQTGNIPTEIKFEKFEFIGDSHIIMFEDDDKMDASGDVYVFDLRSRVEQPFLYQNEPFSIGAKVNDLFLDGDSLLWVGAQNGLWAIDYTKNEVMRLTQSGQLENVNILCIHRVGNGEFWLGTATQGISIFNSESGNIRQISTDQGLPNNSVVSILADDEQNRWVSTLDGITVFNTNEDILLRLKQSGKLIRGELKLATTKSLPDGLISNQLNLNSANKLPDGRLVFGSENGFNVLDPELVINRFAKVDRNEVYLTRLEYYSPEHDDLLVIQGSFVQNGPIQIPADHRYLQLDFALSRYVMQDEHNYQYRLIPVGPSNEEISGTSWTNLGAESQVTINNLSVGDYIVQVRGFDHQGNGVGKPLEVSIHVNEVFYKTWWFYTLMALLFIITAAIWLERLSSEKKRLESEVLRRTGQIREDKAIIESQATRLEELDQAKSRFFTNISHEFRTPLTVILGMADQIDRPERAKTLITRNAKLMLRLINQILELRKLESGGLTAWFVQGDVVGYFRYIIESFQSLAEDKTVILSLKAKPDQIVLDYDPEKLLHIMSNLLTNAIKFTLTGGEVTVSIELHENADKPYYQFKVSDSGIGIPKEKLANIFDRFYQLDDELSRTGSGTGIGLTLVKELVTLLNGKITVESNPGKGTTFNVRLPLSNRADRVAELPDVTVVNAILPETLAEQTEIRGQTEDADVPSLLIVEDNSEVREYLVSCLDEEYRLITAADGQEGIDLALKLVPDIIISDVMMPRVDGFTLCDTLKTDVRTSHIPIILLTAKADIESRITGLTRGADAYLTKPFDKQELEAQMQNLLTLRQKLRARYANLDQLEPSEDAATRQEDEFIISIKQVILENMAKDGFGVPELCRAVGMSRTQLHNKIKSLTDKPTSHIIRRVRIRKAIELMQDPDLNIGQIAVEVGMDSLPYFSKTFSQEMGLSPSKYREKLLDR